MPEAVVVSACRTYRKGTLAGTSAIDLAHAVVQAAMVLDVPAPRAA